MTGVPIQSNTNIACSILGRGQWQNEYTNKDHSDGHSGFDIDKPRYFKLSPAKYSQWLESV
jgi:hypothetical protein